MKRLIVVCIAFVVLAGCSKSNPTKEPESPTKEFKSIVKRLTNNIGKMPDVVHETHGGKSTFAFGKTGHIFDVKKTNSTVTPLVGTIELFVPVRFTHPKQKEAIKETFDCVFHYSYTDGKWLYDTSTVKDINLKFSDSELKLPIFEREIIKTLEDVSDIRTIDKATFGKIENAMTP